MQLRGGRDDGSPLLPSWLVVEAGASHQIVGVDNDRWKWCQVAEGQGASQGLAGKAQGGSGGGEVVGCGGQVFGFLLSSCLHFCGSSLGGVLGVDVPPLLDCPPHLISSAVGQGAFEVRLLH